MTEQFDAQGRPVRVKVGPVDYTVSWHPREWMDVYGRRGHCNDAYQALALCEDIGSSRLATTFLHEICHAVNNESACSFEDMNDEAAARVYSSGLTAFWRDNPLTFAWWAGLLGFAMQEEIPHAGTTVAQ